MTKTLHARFDGEALHPEEPLPLAPNTRVLVTVESGVEEEELADAGIPLPAGVVPGAPYSFLKYAQTLQLEGPEDWSERLEDYLYGNDPTQET